ncbi:MAG: HD domain-containing protein [Bacteroidales bacterium]|nr:HD domain-containing protein [Bacteroidales bacterium]
MNADLKKYIESNILPLYQNFDAAHQLDHIEMVIEQSLDLAAKYGLDSDMAYTIAAYHDLGMVEGRKTHHIVSGRIMREDAALRRWFSQEEIELMAEAVEDHRASSDHEPRSIYGKVVAEADRYIEPEKIIERTIQYGLANYPGLDKNGQFQRALEHINAKYADGGYLKLWFPDSPNAARLEHLRNIIRDNAAFRALFDEIYDRIIL